LVIIETGHIDARFEHEAKILCTRKGERRKNEEGRIGRKKEK